MTRYDARLSDPRGSVRANMHPRRSTGRGLRPGEMRGYRGGSAGRYGGRGYDRGYEARLVDYRGESSPRGPDLGAGRQRRDAGDRWSPWTAGPMPSRAGGYDSDTFSPYSAGRGGYYEHYRSRPERMPGRPRGYGY